MLACIFVKDEILRLAYKALLGKQYKVDLSPIANGYNLVIIEHDIDLAQTIFNNIAVDRAIFILPFAPDHKPIPSIGAYQIFLQSPITAEQLQQAVG